MKQPSVVESSILRTGSQKKKWTTGAVLPSVLFGLSALIPSPSANAACTSTAAIQSVGVSPAYYGGASVLLGTFKFTTSVGAVNLTAVTIKNNAGTLADAGFVASSVKIYTSTVLANATNVAGTLFNATAGTIGGGGAGTTASLTGVASIPAAGGTLYAGVYADLGTGFAAGTTI